MDEAGGESRISFAQSGRRIFKPSYPYAATPSLSHLWLRDARGPVVVQERGAHPCAVIYSGLCAHSGLTRTTLEEHRQG
jgi:hypothetical protein